MLSRTALWRPCFLAPGSGPSARPQAPRPLGLTEAVGLSLRPQRPEGWQRPRGERERPQGPQGAPASPLGGLGAHRALPSPAQRSEGGPRAVGARPRAAGADCAVQAT